MEDTGRADHPNPNRDRVNWAKIPNEMLIDKVVRIQVASHRATQNDCYRQFLLPKLFPSFFILLLLLLLLFFLFFAVISVCCYYCCCQAYGAPLCASVLCVLLRPLAIIAVVIAVDGVGVVFIVASLS